MRMIFLAGLAVMVVMAMALRAGADTGALTPIWELRPGTHVESTPAIDQNGNVYATISGNINYLDATGGKLVCVTSNGVERWAYKIPSDIKSSPALGDDGTIYFGARDRKLYAISDHGKLRWSFPTGNWVDASPAIGTNGVVYCGSWDQKFYALNPDGTKKWEFATGGPIDSSAAIAEDGTIYFGSHDKNFYALNPDGTKKWVFTTGGAVISSPALNCDGVIYFTSVDGKLYALNPDGTKKWEKWTGGIHESSPVLDAEGNLYLGISDVFQAFTPDGTPKWDFGHPILDGSAAVGADGMIYFAANVEGVGVLYTFSPEGQLKFYTPLGGMVSASPALGQNPEIYMGSYGLQGFQVSAGLAKSCWPKSAAVPGRPG